MTAHTATYVSCTMSISGLRWLTETPPLPERRKQMVEFPTAHSFRRMLSPDFRRYNFFLNLTLMAAALPELEQIVSC